MGENICKSYINEGVISKYVENSYNLITKKQTIQLKWTERIWTGIFLKEGHTDGQNAHGKMFNIIN